MYAKLNKNIALRSWRKVPRAYYRRGAFYARPLYSKEWEFLLRCDGETEIEDSPENKTILDFVQAQGLCAPCAKGEGGPLTAWQRYRHCDNMYTPNAILIITGKCNFNCRHCFNAVDNAAVQTEMSFEQCKKLITEMSDCGVQSVMLTGGEPLLHPHFDDILRELAKVEIHIDTILTNGTLLTAEKLDLMTSLGFHPRIEISYDGVGTHDWLRRKAGSEEDVMRVCRLIVDKGLNLKLQANVHKGNVDAILPTARIAAELGAAEFRAIRTTESPRWLHNQGESLSFDEYYDFVLRFAEDCIKESESLGNTTIETWHGVILWPRGKRYAVSRAGQRPADWDTRPFCRGVRGRITITSDGEAAPCPPSVGYITEHGISLGNVFKSSLRDVLNGDAGKYHDFARTPNSVRKICHECGWKERCLGGCPLLACGLGKGDFTGCDPMQRIFFQNGWADKVDALFARYDWQFTMPS